MRIRNLIIIISRYIVYGLIVRRTYSALSSNLASEISFAIFAPVSFLMFLNYVGDINAGAKANAKSTRVAGGPFQNWPISI